MLDKMKHAAITRHVARSCTELDKAANHTLVHRLLNNKAPPIPHRRGLNLILPLVFGNANVQHNALTDSAYWIVL